MERLQLKIETNSYAISTPARASYEEHTSQFDCPQEIVTGQLCMWNEPLLPQQVINS